MKFGNLQSVGVGRRTPASVSVTAVVEGVSRCSGCVERPIRAASASGTVTINVETSEMRD